MLEHKPRAAVMFSAGLDSTIQIKMLLNDGYEVFPITFDDDSSMTRLKRDFALEFWLSYYDLVRNHLPIRYMKREELRMPNGFVPGWKLTMVMSALAYCQRFNIPSLHLGYLKDDRYPYPDEGPDAFKRMATLYNDIYGSEIEIVTMDKLTKVELIQFGMRYDLPLEKTFSCRDVTVAGLTHCGKCDVCKMRWHAFKDAGFTDKAYYVTLDHIDEPLKNGERLGYDAVRAKLPNKFSVKGNLLDQYVVVCDQPDMNDYTEEQVAEMNRLREQELRDRDYEIACRHGNIT